MKLEIHEETGHVSFVWWATVVCVFALVSQGKFNVSSTYYKTAHCWMLPYLSNRIYYDYASIYFKQLTIPIMH